MNKTVLQAKTGLWPFSENLPSAFRGYKKLKALLVKHLKLYGNVPALQLQYLSV